MANSDNKINIGDVWKDLETIQINIGDVWKDVAEGYINIGDSWKQFWAPAGYWFGCDAEPAAGNETSVADYTYIFNETVPTGGNITKIEIYVSDESAGVLHFAVFDGPGGTGSYTDEHAVLSLAISNGLNQYESPGDFDSANLPIDVGQYIGCYVTSSGIWTKINEGTPGYIYDQFVQISGTPAASSFTLSGNNDEFQIRVWIE